MLKLLKNPERDKDNVIEKNGEKKTEESVDKERDTIKQRDERVDRTKLRFSKENREKIREKRESNSRDKEKGSSNDRPKSTREKERDSKVKLGEYGASSQNVQVIGVELYDCTFQILVTPSFMNIHARLHPL